MATQANRIPAGFHTAIPVLSIRNAANALDFYKCALGADERMRFTAPDRTSIVHAELTIGDSLILVGEEHPRHGVPRAADAGGTSVFLYLYGEDVDQVFHQAASAGTAALMPVADMFWRTASEKSVILSAMNGRWLHIRKTSRPMKSRSGERPSSLQ